MELPRPKRSQAQGMGELIEKLIHNSIDGPSVDFDAMLDRLAKNSVERGSLSLNLEKSSPNSFDELCRVMSISSIDKSRISSISLDDAMLDRSANASPGQPTDLQLLQAIRSSGLIKNRWYRLQLYKSCFVGTDCVQWMVANGTAKSEQECVTQMQRLIDQKLLHHVTDDHSFKNEYLFYRFFADESTAAPTVAPTIVPAAPLLVDGRANHNSAELWYSRKAEEWQRGLQQAGKASNTQASKRGRPESTDVLMAAENLVIKGKLGKEAAVSAIDGKSAMEKATAELQQAKADALARAKVTALANATANVGGNTDLLIALACATKLAGGDYRKGATDLSQGLVLAAGKSAEEKKQILEDIAVAAVVGKELVKMAQAPDITTGMSMAENMPSRERTLILDVVAEAVYVDSLVTGSAADAKASAK